MLLAIDSSTNYIGLALYDGASVLYESCITSPNRHTATLAPAVKKMLADTEIKIEDLKGICIASGPGSFTSLRVGMAFAKGMALTLKIPLIGVPTFDILTEAQPADKMPLCVFLQSGRGKLAVCFYHFRRNSWESAQEIEVYTAESLCEKITENTLVCGEFTAELRAYFRKTNKNMRLASPAQSLRRPGYLAEIAWKKLKKGDYSDTSSLAPIYLHAKDPIPD